MGCSCNAVQCSTVDWTGLERRTSESAQANSDRQRQLLTGRQRKETETCSRHCKQLFLEGETEGMIPGRRVCWEWEVERKRIMGDQESITNNS